MWGGEIPAEFTYFIYNTICKLISAADIIWNSTVVQQVFSSCEVQKTNIGVFSFPKMKLKKAKSVEFFYLIFPTEMNRYLRKQVFANCMYGKELKCC